MAFTGDLGRVQGASTFHTMAESSISVAISSLQPQLTPFVGDAVQFPNGDIRQVKNVSGSTVTLGDVLFSFKGDPGIGNATLSNIDGDSTENGFTQQATKGIAQAKNYYNLGAYDSYVSNGDGTGSATRKTGYLVIDANSDIQVVQNPNGTHRCIVARNLPISSATAIKSNYLQRASFDDVYLGRQCFAVYDSVTVVVSILGVTTESEYRLYFSQHPLIFQYELASKYQYTQKVIENQPIRPANQEEEFYWHEEWRKGLNLIDLSKVQSRTVAGITFTVNNNSIILNGTSTSTDAHISLFTDLDKVRGRTIILSGKPSDQIYLEGNYADADGSESGHYFNGQGIADGTKAIYIPNDAQRVHVYCGVRSGVTADNVTIYPMLVYGAHSYPYTSYHGKLIHEKDLSATQLFPEGENPAQTIGGDWEDKGTVTTSDGTTFHAYRRLS